MNQITIFKAIILGIIQGATEFLPISSSAHLVIFQHLFNVDLEAGPIVAFDVCLHVGTLLAVIFALRKEVMVIIRGFFVPTTAGDSLDGGFAPEMSRRAVWLIIIGTIPAVIIGFSFKGFFEELFTGTLPVGIALIVTGIVLFATRFVKRHDVDLPKMKWWHAIAVGLAQAAAIIPGISRSGSTISVGLFSKLDPQLAAKFSFLLSIPAIGGAAILEWKNFQYISQTNVLSIIFGTLFAFIVGYLCVRWMLAIMRGVRLSWFAVYCWIVGTITIVTSLI